MMMMQGLKLTALFLGYGTVGLSGDYVAKLLTADAHMVDAEVLAPAVDVRVDVDVDPEVRLEIDPSWNTSDRCDYTEERRVAVDASASELLRLTVGSGELQVRGREGLRRVEAVGRVCASEASFLDELTVTLERRGDQVVLTAHYPDMRGRNNRGNGRRASIDLVVEVPMGMAADVDDSSGGMEISGTGDLRIDDSSGSIWVENIRGGLIIDDSSGEIEARDVSGDVEIEDSSGDIDVEGVAGELRINDGSGSINVSNVERDVIVERDGSGSIDVDGVRGGLSVLRDGSGRIRYSRISGAVDVPADKRRGRRGN